MIICPLTRLALRESEGCMLEEISRILASTTRDDTEKIAALKAMIERRGRTVDSGPKPK